MKFIKQNKVPLLFAILSAAFYLSFAYDLERTDFIKLISLYGALFFTTYLFIEKYKLNFWFLISLGIFFRLIFIFAIPNLSQDYFRFIWDGRLMAQGISPYLFTPKHYIDSILQFRSLPGVLSGAEITMFQAQQLYEGMGTLSAGHFSNYPPINQFFFAVATLLGGQSILGSVIIMRVILILADVGILYYGKEILKKLNLPVENIFWYFLNPFIIIELTGNLHFEGVMIFFLVWSISLLFNRKWVWAALIMGMSISVKLLPLLFLPLFIHYFTNTRRSTQGLKAEEFPLKRLFIFYAVIAGTVIFTFIPFHSSEFIQHFFSTIALWFQTFEFNASVYYIIRWVGFRIVGYNVIEIVGKILPIVVLLFVLALTYLSPPTKRKGRSRTRMVLITSMLFASCFYFLLSTTVHPWYLATPLFLSVFTRYKFVIVWTLMVVLSYSAYGIDAFDENLWLVALEYLVVISFAIWEIFYYQPITNENNRSRITN